MLGCMAGAKILVGIVAILFFPFLWEGSVSLVHGQLQEHNRPLSLSMIDTHEPAFWKLDPGLPKNWKPPFNPLVNQCSPWLDGRLRWSLHDHFQAPNFIVFPMSTYSEYRCSNHKFLWLTEQLIYDQRLWNQVLFYPLKIQHASWKNYIFCRWSSLYIYMNMNMYMYM